MPACPICNKVLNSHQGVISHTEAVHGKQGVLRGVTAWEKNRQQAGIMTTGAELHDGNVAVEYDIDHYEGTGMFQCPVCYRDFNTFNGLDRHANSGVHSEKAYRCSDCSRTFPSLASLTDHTTHSSCNHARHVTDTLTSDYENNNMLRLTNGGERDYEAVLTFDGGAKHNPGEGGAGFVLRGRNGNVLERNAVEMMETGVTSNQAEYCGIIVGMECALRFNVRTLRIRGDSDLILKQLKGDYNCNSQNIRPFFERARDLASEFAYVKLEWIPRDQNSEADALATQGRDGYGIQMHQNDYGVYSY